MTAPILPPQTLWIDPDDAPPITARWIAEDDLYHGETLIRRAAFPDGTPPARTKD